MNGIRTTEKISTVGKSITRIIPELVEGNGYERRQTSKWHVIVMVLAWSRDVKPAHTNIQKQYGVSSDTRGERRVVFPL